MMLNSRPKAAASVHARWILLIVLFAAVARFLLVLNLPIRILPYDVHEDGLFMRLAANLASGVWPGEFNQLTFLKGPGYPFFLAATSLSRLPLSAAQALFQTVAISAAAWVVFRLTRSQSGAAATFVALAFCPVGLALHRVLPDQIYWAQTLLVFSLFATILFTPPRRRFPSMAVAGLGGLVFGWTFLTGECGVWFIPAFAFLTLGAVLEVRRGRDELFALVRNLCVATAGFVAVNAAFLARGLDTYGSPVGVAEQYFTSAQWSSLPRTFVPAVEAVWHPDLAATTPSCSVSVESDDFKRYWRFLNYPRAKTVQPNREVAVVGWYYNDQSVEWPVFKAYTQDGQEIPSLVTRQVSPDIQHHFSDQRASNNRFQVVIRSPDVCTITARVSDGTELRMVLDPRQGLYAASGGAQLNVDSVSDNAGVFVDRGENLPASASLSLIGLYKGLAPFLLTIGLIAAFVASWRAFSARVLSAMPLTALSAWILAGTCIVLLALSNASALSAATINYFAPASYMAILAACLSLTTLSVGSRPE
jgi:hypothetical protein